MPETLALPSHKSTTSGEPSADPYKLLPSGEGWAKQQLKATLFVFGAFVWNCSFAADSI